MLREGSTAAIWNGVGLLGQKGSMGPVTCQVLSSSSPSGFKMSYKEEVVRVNSGLLRDRDITQWVTVGGQLLGAGGRRGQKWQEPHHTCFERQSMVPPKKTQRMELSLLPINLVSHNSLGHWI